MKASSRSARECYDKAITPRCGPTSIPSTGAASPRSTWVSSRRRYEDLEHVTSREPKYDLHRAHRVCSRTRTRTPDSLGEAEALFQQRHSSFRRCSETYFNYATFLAVAEAARPRRASGRERILAKKPTMPRYLQRRERPWFRKAGALLKRLPKVG